MDDGGCSDFYQMKIKRFLMLSHQDRTDGAFWRGQPKRNIARGNEKMILKSVGYFLPIKIVSRFTHRPSDQQEALSNSNETSNWAQFGCVRKE